MGEGSGSSIFFFDYFGKIGLPQDIIASDIGEMYGFDDNKSTP